MEIQNDYWNLTESVVIDRSTKSYQYNEFKENDISNILANSNYEITIKKGTWKLLSKAYLHVKSKIDPAPRGGVVTVSNNGLNDFSYAILTYENREIERIDNLGVTSTICNLTEFSGDVSDSVASSLCWYMDTSDKADINRFENSVDATQLKASEKIITDILKQNVNFNKGYAERLQLTKDGKILEKFIPLSKVFRFCRDIPKVLNGEIIIRLRKNDYKNILHAVNDLEYGYKITYLSIWIPEVEPSLQIRENLTDLLASNTTTQYGFNYVNGYRSTLQTAIDGTWRITNTQNKVSGIYVVFSKVGRESNYKNSLMIFDNMNMERIYININNKQFPTKPFETNFNPKNLDYMRLYVEFLNAGLKNDMDEGKEIFIE
ncbi:hypothetical protein PPYR_14973 [Photinus pyralis]|uniref:Uncharacterized protein n=2 Tax=Photinus pyralis TaxID=7054 RepID=A0A5N3ZZW7_PHOPY|nr:hypothetical protein PPYR_14973 [Photinus pyralis]